MNEGCIYQRAADHDLNYINYCEGYIRDNFTARLHNRVEFTCDPRYGFYWCRKFVDDIVVSRGSCGSSAASPLAPDFLRARLILERCGASHVRNPLGTGQALEVGPALEEA